MGGRRRGERTAAHKPMRQTVAWMKAALEQTAKIKQKQNKKGESGRGGRSEGGRNKESCL